MNLRLPRCLAMLCGLGAFATTAWADEALRLHAMFAPHAVLQRDAPIRVYGTAAPRANITIELADQQATTRADAKGHWQAQLPALPAGGPHVLQARAGTQTQRVEDVLIGDVWLCSGQSNMVIQVHRSLDARAEIAGASNDRIRLLNIGETGSVTPLETFATPVAWLPTTPENVPNFSAACFYYARELQKTVDVPMGLIVAAWGGSRIQAWASAEAWRGARRYGRELGVLARYGKDPIDAAAEWGRLWQQWWRAQPTVAKGDEPWNDGGAGWAEAPKPLVPWERWGVPALANFDGMVWYRTRVTLSKAQASGDAVLALGPADEVDMTWFNGRGIGSSYGWDAPRRYTVPRASLRAGENLIAVNVLDTYRDGGLVGPPEARKLILHDGTEIALDGPWQYRAEARDAPAPPRAPWHTAAGITTLYNGMIAPIGRYGVRGLLWYQGESNTGEPAEYEALLGTLIADWRARFGAQLPFLNVQLAAYGQPSPTPMDSGWAQVREAQRVHAKRDPRYGYVTTIDIGDRYDIHPPNKQELGRRLARLARHLVYGETALPPTGPTPVSANAEGNAIVLRFEQVTGALQAFGAATATGFELCEAAPKTCQWAEARVVDGAIALRAANVATATRVRYAWADYPIVNVIDGAGLPVVPFEIAISR